MPTVQESSVRETSDQGCILFERLLKDPGTRLSYPDTAALRSIRSMPSEIAPGIQPMSATRPRRPKATTALFISAIRFR